MTEVKTLTIHPWEITGLGKAPFKFIGQETIWHQVPGGPRKPGSSCDYCTQAIAEVYWIFSSDQKKFKVGCDCVWKVYDKRNAETTEESRFVTDIKRAKSKAEKQKRDNKRKELSELLKNRVLNDSDLREKLQARPHPMGFKDRQTGEPLTTLDWAEWMVTNSGLKGLQQLNKALKTFI